MPLEILLISQIWESLKSRRIHKLKTSKAATAKKMFFVALRSGTPSWATSSVSKTSQGALGWAG